MHQKVFYIIFECLLDLQRHSWRMEDSHCYIIIQKRRQK